jgi:EAL domain-containing protein (putative c-di-GMP-specific phosphodiesterase class I)
VREGDVGVAQERVGVRLVRAGHAQPDAGAHVAQLARDGVGLAQLRLQALGDALRLHEVTDPRAEHRELVAAHPGHDVALSHAKRSGRDRVELYSGALRTALLRRLELEQELHWALEAGELVMHYQPQVDLVTGRVRGVEGLMRWPHPVLGPISPGEFIPVAEDSGLIGPLGAWAIEETCRQLAAWRREARLPGLTATVNVSMHQLEDPGFPAVVRAALAASGVAPAALCLELTESALMGAGPVPLRALAALKDLGLYVAVDDFGTGYSSLASLKRLPVEVVKVDRSFVDGLGTEPGDSAIVAAILSLGHALGLHVIAEGVESPLQASELLALGCTVAQGFHYSPAVAPERVPALVRGRYAPTAGRRTAARGLVDEILHQVGIPG